MMVGDKTDKAREILNTAKQTAEIGKVIAPGKAGRGLDTGYRDHRGCSDRPDHLGSDQFALSEEKEKMMLLVVVFLWFVLKALPTWKGVKDGDKDVRLAEIGVREKEAEARVQQAASFAELSSALGSISDVLNNVAIKQKEATDKVLILSRVNAESNERNDEKFDLVIEHIDSLTRRVESVERLVKGKENGSQAKNATPTT